MSESGHSWARILFPSERQVVRRVLVVADGILEFNKTEFGLSEFCSVLREPVSPWETVVLTTAHRSAAPKGAHISEFSFDMTPSPPDLPFSIDNYDQVWLFGFSGQKGKPLTAAEVDKIIEFMNSGGGVFATGDHQDLGFALCSEIPRVRSMRRWRFFEVPRGSTPAPGLNDLTRIDTLRQGLTVGFQFADQSDGTPQEIRPRFITDADQKGSHPHPVLKFGVFAITVLPDHMHEGECVVPTGREFEATYCFRDRNIDEYPVLADGTRLPPEVVAISTSAGGFVTDDEAFPVEPRAFNIIVAYDGHLVQQVIDGKGSPLGRVVVDSSFHHFVDTNLIGTGSSNPNATGFFDENGRPTADYVAIKQYFRNILSWLSPPGQQVEYYLRVLLGLRYMSPLVEEISDSLSPTDPENVLFAGRVTRRAIAERLSLIDASLCARALAELATEPARTALKESIGPLPPGRRGKRQRPVAIDSTEFVETILGGVILQLGAVLPPDPYDANDFIRKYEMEGTGLRGLAQDGLVNGITALSNILTNTTRTLNAVNPELETLDTRTRSRREVTEEKNKEENMPSKCFKKYRSIRRRGGVEIERGHVQVRESGTSGKHLEKGKEVAVQCNPTTMVWDIPDTGPVEEHYYGVFDGLLKGFDENEDHCSGTCTIFHFRDSKTVPFAQDTDDWEATKVGA